MVAVRHYPCVMPADDRRRSPVPPGDRRPPHRLRLLAPLLTTLFVVVALFGASRPVSAHTKLVESEPANVSKVAPPVDSVRLTFTKASEPVRDRFTVTGPDGATITPASVDNDGDKVVVAKFAEPLPEGRNRVRWAIRAGDTHVMTGSLSFTVTPSATADAATTGDTPPDAAATDDTPPDAAASEAASPVGETADPAEDIDAEPLAAEVSTGIADWIATLARWIVYAGLLLVVGGLGYLAWVHRGTVAETRRFVFWVRRAAVLVVVGAVLGWLAQVSIYAGGGVFGMFSPSAWGDVITSNYAIGTVARIGGALLVLRFLVMDVADDRPAPRRRAAADTDDDTGWGVTTVAGRGGVALLERSDVIVRTRLRTSSSPLAFVGAALLVISEWFTGHTAVTEPWLVVVPSDAAHVVAAALWATGALMLAATLQGRRRRGEPLDAALLGTRFSVVATWSLVAVAVTGTVLAWTIMEGLGGLFSTSFGKWLVAKLVVVAVIAGIGAYNHRRLVPELATRDEDVERQFVRTVSVEAALFGVVLVVTGLLVAASPV